MRANLTTHPCGCTTFTDPEWGVTRAYTKCDHHKTEGGKTGLKHHEEMGAIMGDIVQHEKYERELLECLHIPDGPGHVLEIGCGVGVYVPMFHRKGYTCYEGVEPDVECAIFCSKQYQVFMHMVPYEELPVGDTKFTRSRDPFDLILACHVFEHMEDAPGMMAKAFSQLKSGGRLVLIVPDDEDLVNPDHLWFFNCETLLATLSRIGFKGISINGRRRIQRECFLYATATKP